MEKPPVVSRSEWLDARKALLEEEKALTRQRDRLAQKRRSLPWVAVEKTYTFDTHTGKVSLRDLFQGKSQLLIYHFMYGPDWEAGCKSCSFWADNYDGAVAHLKQRDVTMIAVSRAPLETLDAFKERMGWKFEWVSSGDTDFNYDFQASFKPEELDAGQVFYNYRATQFPSGEAPGVSVFHKDPTGKIFHTYSCYARGLDPLNGTYQLLDLVPKGRDEEGLAYPMEWVRLHDEYGD